MGEIVHARSGDKGGDANLVVWGRNPQGWGSLQSTLTVDELRRRLPDTRELAIERYELPNLVAVNFLIRGLLGTGATSSLRLDSQAKALGETVGRNSRAGFGVIQYSPHQSGKIVTANPQSGIPATCNEGGEISTVEAIRCTVAAEAC
ncbi:MAG: hypothetical protein ACLP4W_01790 [Mycobacterium sp.]|uniref:AtuA-related protein n=1 Tax=Mycobacterium sp. TaxID=1785 RepID=UPI003F99FDA8